MNAQRTEYANLRRQVMGSEHFDGELTADSFNRRAERIARHTHKHGVLQPWMWVDAARALHTKYVIYG